MKTRTFIAAGLAVHARTITTTQQLIFRAWLWTGFLAFATIAFGPQPAQAAVTEAWMQRYGSVAGSSDSAYKVVTDAAGNVIVAGTTTHNQTGSWSDMLVIKYSGAGVPLWTNRYNGTGNGYDQATAVAVDGSGNVFVTGSSVGSGGDSHYATIAYSGAGVPLWTNRYNVPANSSDQATAVAVDASGNVFVTGSSYDSGGNYDYATIAFSGAGVPLWTHRYNGPENGLDYASAVAVDASGNVFVTGDSVGSGGNSDYATIAFSGAGVPLWTNRYNGPGNGSDSAKAVAVDASGNVFVTGSSVGSGGNSDYATIAFSGAGVPLWTNRYNGPENGWDYASAVAVDASGNVFVTGDSYGSGGSSFDSATIAYSGAGVPLWTNRYNGPGNNNDYATAVAVDASGNVFVTGTSYGSGGSSSDYATIAYSGAGVPLWTHRYHGPRNGWDYAATVAVDDSGNVFVTGSSAGSGGDSDYATIAYSGAGVPLWTNRYEGPANSSFDQASAVAVDRSGNVFVTGFSVGGGGYTHYATIAYSGAGVPLWTNRYNGPANGYDQASAVAVDGSGNVFVTGTSFGSGGNNDYATIAYSGAGVPLWTNRYNGPANSDDVATAVAVDASGNVFVTGYSGSSGGSYDYATIAYSGAGVPLWIKRYNGPGNDPDIPYAVAVDGSGNVFVTGYSVGSGGNNDYATIAYSSAGVTLWTKHYDGPGNGGASAVAVDGSGNVFVTGSSGGSGGGGDLDYATIAYSGAGVPLWTNHYSGPGDNSDTANAVAVDGSGNVFVTGSSYGSGGDIDYATIAYSGAGVPLWTNRYNGPANSDDVATAVAVDGRGNVVVTGWTDGSRNPSASIGGDYYTAKYAGTDGAILWEKRFNRLPFDFVSSPCLAIGPNGMVVVIGSSSGDFATVVYREVPTVSIDLVSTGIRLRFTGVPGRSYKIERAPAVTGPWSTINTQTAPASGLLEYLETLPHPGSGFYRIAQP